jgi:hypothetical protein
MSYFWIIPVAIAVFLVIWGFYGYVKRNAGEREDGTILRDDPTERQV